MTGPVRKNIRRRVRRKPMSMGSFPTSAIRYSGPLGPSRDDSTVVVMPLNASISSNGTGDISGTFNNNPSSAVNWSEYSTSWGEYRVLGVRFTYIPQFSANTTVVSGFSGYHGIIYGTSSLAPANLSEAAATGIARLWNPFRPFVREWRMSSVEQAAWVNTSSPALTSNCLTLYGQNGSFSILYGNMLIEYTIQFRSHRK